MMDEADQAFERQSLINDVCVAHVAGQIKRGPSMTHCKECGDAIPEKRQALGGVAFCTDCQADNEAISERRLIPKRY